MNRVEDYPAEDEKLRAIEVDRRYGGNCPNTLEVLQQLIGLSKFSPVPLALFAVLPSSSSDGTMRIKSSFASAVDLTHCIYREECEEPASSYIIRSRSAGSRTIINYNDLPEMTSKEFITMAGQLGHEMSWCHFEARSTLLCAGVQYIMANYLPGANTRSYFRVYSVSTAMLSRC
jgi:ketohexokinase